MRLYARNNGAANAPRDGDSVKNFRNRQRISITRRQVGRRLRICDQWSGYMDEKYADATSQGPILREAASENVAENTRQPNQK